MERSRPRDRLAARRRATGLRERRTRATLRSVRIDPVAATHAATRVVVPIPAIAGTGPFVLATFVVAAIVATIVTMRRPSIGLGALLVAIPFDFAHRLGPTTISLPKAILVGIAIALVARRTSLAPLRDPRIRAIVGGAVALVVVNALTFFPATFVEPVVREILKAAEYVALFVCATLAFADREDDALFWRALAIGTTLVCAFAIVQDFTIAPSGLYVHNKIVPRIAGPLEGPNQLAGYLDIAATLLVARALLGEFSYGYAAVAVLAVVVDSLTISRAGAFGLAAGAGMVLVFAWRDGASGRARVRAALACLVFPILALVAVYLSAGATSIADATARIGGEDESTADNGLSQRGALWRAAWRLFLRDPALGIGAGNYEFLTPTVGLIGVRTHANSVYLQSLAEGGIALFAVVVWTLVAAFATMLRAARSPLAVGVAAATLGLGVHEFFDTLTFFPKVGDVWWLVLGVGAAAVVRDAVIVRGGTVEAEPSLEGR